MEFKEFYNFSISPAVTTTFSIEWSEDNHVSIITERGVHVFEFIPYPMSIHPTLRLWRTFIYPSPYFPTERYAKYVNETVPKLSREEMYKLFLEESMTPQLDERAAAVPKIVKLAWSPIDLAKPSKCLLAILTAGGSVEILFKFGSDWLSIWNLSSSKCQEVEKETGIIGEEATGKSFVETSYQEHARRFIATAVVWSPKIQPTETFACLAIAFRSNELTIARIDAIADLSTPIEPTFLFQKNLDSTEKIEELAWIDLGKDLHAILISYADGAIHGLVLRWSKTGFVEKNFWKYELPIGRISTATLRTIKRDDGSFLVLTAKRHCLVVLTLRCSNGECFEKRYFKLDGFSVSGLTWINSEEALVTTQDASFHWMMIPKSGEEIWEKSIKHDLRDSKVQYLGVAHSTNSAILMNVASPESMYDHLLNREPTIVQIFALTGEKFDPWRTVGRKLEEKKSLITFWDCLECMRLNAAKSQEPRKILPEITEKRLSESTNIDELRVVMWVTLMGQVLEKKQMLRGVEKIIGEISEAQPMIFLTSGCDLLSRLSKKSELTAEQKLCANFLRMYMEVYIAGEDEDEKDEKGAEDKPEYFKNDINRRVSEILASSSHLDSIETEICDLCGEILSDLPWIANSCISGHKLPRCSISLLQITSTTYRSCPICGRMIHPSLDSFFERCIYCDVPAIHDSRIKSIKNFESQWKNLSKRPLQQPDPRASNDTEGTLEKARKRAVNPQVFAVIVNQEEDSMITETWQEF